MKYSFDPTLAFGFPTGGELVIIFIIVLLLFGAKKVPELFRSLGKGVKEFRKAKTEWEQDISEVMTQDPIEDHDFKATESSQEKTKEGEEAVHHEDATHESEKQTAS